MRSAGIQIAMPMLFTYSKNRLSRAMLLSHGTGQAVNAQRRHTYSHANVVHIQQKQASLCQVARKSFLQSLPPARAGFFLRLVSVKLNTVSST